MGAPPPVIPHFAPEAWGYVFNTPLECGVRCAVLLATASPVRCDIQRLVQYEYLLVHSGDIEGGPPSLHPPTPHRSGELLVRRALVERGVALMMSKSVICREFSKDGISYYAGEVAVPFLDMLSSSYTRDMLQSARWVIQRFGAMSDDDLSAFMRRNWTNWGSEFSLRLQGA